MKTLWMLALIVLAGCQTSSESVSSSSSVNTYQNLIIYADYFAPDVVAINGDFLAVVKQVMVMSTSITSA
ncbi:hypothetical protein [uncultured Gilvimarinus sp.]|uniref:hypothetical protein n=1 Tax=uncultured Gilvimarinus sp. TaxID=1689143 RepID=UPI0030EF5BFF|tara:strand:- start:1163 stop:1372 length:210 start_codon:yes stop_codon:yes gene_type:complete